MFFGHVHILSTGWCLLLNNGDDVDGDDESCGDDDDGFSSKCPHNDHGLTKHKIVCA